MQQTDTFFLNLFCAATFCIFVLTGLFLCFFKKQLGTVRDYQKLGGIVLLLLAVHVIFVDYEIFLGTVQYADYVRIGIVVADFVFVVGFIARLMVKGLKAEAAEEQQENSVSKQVRLCAAAKKPVNQENSSPNNVSSDRNEQASTPSESPSQPIQESVQPLSAAQAQEVSLSQDTIQSQETTQLQASAVNQDEKPGGVVVVEGVDKDITEEVVADDVVSSSEETPSEHNADAVTATAAANNSINKENASENKSDEVVVEEEDSTSEETNIDDLIFFQKLEFLMAQKKLFTEQDISREQIASAVGTNRTYLTRSIKNATGKTFLEYITDLRTSYAATLLTTTNEPLDVIGTIAGFGSKSAYYRAFGAAYGCSPSEYRKR